MLVFLDDSGDPSFKFDKGSTKFFVIAAVIIEDNLVAEEISLAIKKLKRDIKIADHIEFKFTKSSRENRIKFLESVNKYQFSIRTVIVDKRYIKSDLLQNNKSSFYSYFIKTLLKNNQGSIKNASIRIDGSNDRHFRKEFITYLRRELNTYQNKVLKDCKLVDSKENTLIQLADMIAGTIHRSYNIEKDDAHIYKQIIKKHIADEWQFK